MERRHFSFVVTRPTHVHIYLRFMINKIISSTVLRAFFQQLNQFIPRIFIASYPDKILPSSMPHMFTRSCVHVSNRLKKQLVKRQPSTH